MNVQRTTFDHSREIHPSLPLTPGDVKEEETEDCCICLGQKFYNGRSVVTIPCGHSYHTDCFDQLTGRETKECPICRREVEIAPAEFSGFSDDENVSSKNHLSPALFAAAESGHSDTLKVLIKNGAKVDCRNDEKLTPLHLAAENGRTEPMIVLMKSGADVNLRDSVGQTAFNILPKYRISTRLLSKLVKHGADVNDSNSQSGKTMLALAAERENVKLIKKLLKKGAKPNLPRQLHAPSSGTPLSHAASLDHVKTVKALIQGGPDANQVSKDGKTALGLASKHGHISDDEKASSKDNLSLALFAAAKNGRVKALKVLIKAGAEVHCRDDAKNTPLHLAVKQGHTKSMDVLIEAGADVNLRNSDGQTVFNILPTNFISTSLLSKLVKHGADVNDRNSKCDATMLALAAELRDVKLTEQLLKKGAKPDLPRRCIHDPSFTTPLLYAAERGHVKIVKALIQGGADANQVSKDGKTALELASNSGHDKVVEFLALQ